MNDLTALTAAALARRIAAREVTSLEVVEAFLSRIEAMNPPGSPAGINALVTVTGDRARDEARRADAAVAGDEPLGPLHGVPFTVKDMIETEGVRTTNGIRALRDNVPGRDATAVARLRAAGGILLGKTNLPAQALDVHTDNRLFGLTRNPWSQAHSAGGSSGGEGAALAAHLTPLGLGTDIGGSVRIPAHFCGVMGFKPTQGRIPTAGLVLPGKVNTVRHMVGMGPMARSVEDLRLAFEILAGPDHRDPDTLPIPLAQPMPRDPATLRVALTHTLGGLPVTASTRTALDHAATLLETAGAQVSRTAPEDFDVHLAWRTYGTLFGIMALAEIPWPLRLIMRLAGPLIMRDELSRAAARAALKGPLDYFRTLAVRDTLTASLDAFLADRDAWILPVTVSPAFPLRAMGRIHTPVDVDGVKVPGNLANTGLTSLCNLTGHPVVTLPAGLTAEGLPVGVQLVGRRFEDMALLDTAEAVAALLPSLPQPTAA